MENLKTDSWRIFDRIAGRYDRVNSVLSLGMDAYWRDELSRRVKDVLHAQVLDLATGTGKVIPSLCRQSPDIEKIVGIDLSAEMLREGQRKAAQFPWSTKVTWCKADAGHLPFKEGTFSVVTAAFGIRNVPDVTRVLGEIRRVLCPGGHIFVLEFSQPANRWLRPFHSFYLRRLVPFLGGCLTRDPGAYRYLQQTIFSFPYGRAFAGLLQKAGYREVRYFPVSAGVITIYQATK